MKWQKGSEFGDFSYLCLAYEGALEVRGGLTSTEVHLGREFTEPDPRGSAGRQNRRENRYGKEVKTKKANSVWAKGQGKAKCNSRKQDWSQRHQGVTTGLHWSTVTTQDGAPARNTASPRHKEK